MLFEELGFYYVGPVDGHNLDHLIPVLRNVRDADVGPVLVHVVTQKGKGYSRRRNPRTNITASANSMSSPARRRCRSRMRRATPRCSPRASSRRRARTTGSSRSPPRCQPGRGLICSRSEFPEPLLRCRHRRAARRDLRRGAGDGRFKPFAAIYSTFLQRAYDQVVHDVAIQKLPVRFAIDRAGLVGADGPTHAGSFDVAYLTCLPGFVVMAAADEVELKHMVATAAAIDDAPSAFRYPRGEGQGRGNAGRGAAAGDRPRTDLARRLGRRAAVIRRAARRMPLAPPSSSPRAACRRRSPMPVSPSRWTRT